MRSAFLVFDLVGRNAGVEREGNARGFIDPELNQRKETSGLSFETRVNRVPPGKGSLKAMSRITAIL